MPGLSVIADYGDLCGEGPIWDFNSQCLYWTDCVGRKFYRYDWTTKRHAIVKDGLEVNGYALNQKGGFIVCNSSGFWSWDGEGNPKLLADCAEGSRCQLNDCIADPEGRLLAGSFFYDPSRDYELGKLVCLETDGRTKVR